MAHEMVKMDRQLQLIEHGRRALAEAKTVGQVKEIRDQAAAIQRYLNQKDGASAASIDAAELKLWAERRLGELLASEGERRGGASKSHDGTLKKGTSQALPAGVNKSQSHRWQKMAEVPEKAFASEIAAAREQQEPPTTAGILRLHKQERKREVVESASCTISDLGKLVQSGELFGTIYADPPWQYSNQTTRASTDNHYRTMTVEEICALPIKDLADDDSHLHLWTTNAFLFDAKRVMDAWGFEYKSVFVWVKPKMGIGNYWRVSHEFLLLGTRGRAPFADRGQMSWLRADRTEHSKKPEAIRKIVELVSPLPRLELFARRAVDGWSVWGNDVRRGMFDKDIPSR